MTWNVEALKAALLKNNDKKGAALLSRLPKWPRPKPGKSTAVVIPRRGKRKPPPAGG